jgi:hypothetical protein
MNKDEALKMAIDALQNISKSLTEKQVWFSSDVFEVINACKEALATNEDSLAIQPAWQGLTDDELSHLKYLHVEYELFDEGEYGTECNVYVDDFAHAIEQALRSKNT